MGLKVWVMVMVLISCIVMVRAMGPTMVQTGSKLGEVVLEVTECALELVQTPRITLQILVVLRVDGIRLARHARCGEQRHNEELRKSACTLTVNRL